MEGEADQNPSDLEEERAWWERVNLYVKKEKNDATDLQMQRSVCDGKEEQDGADPVLSPEEEEV